MASTVAYKVTSVQAVHMADDARYSIPSFHLYIKGIMVHYRFRLPVQRKRHITLPYFHLVQSHHIQRVGRPNHIFVYIQPRTVSRKSLNRLITLVAPYLYTLRIEVIGHHRILPRRYLHLTPSGRQITFNLSPLSIFRIEDNPHGLRQLIRHPFPIQFNLYSANGIIIQHIAEVTASQHWQQSEEQPENHMPCIFHTTHLPDVRSHTKEIFAFVGPIK